MTRDIFKLLDCRGTVRIDFILDQNDVLFVNEPNTIPGSMAFYLWKACGVSSRNWWKDGGGCAARPCGQKQQRVCL